MLQLEISRGSAESNWYSQNGGTICVHLFESNWSLYGKIDRKTKNSQFKQKISVIDVLSVERSFHGNQRDYTF